MSYFPCLDLRRVEEELDEDPEYRVDGRGREEREGGPQTLGHRLSDRSHDLVRNKVPESIEEQNFDQIERDVGEVVDVSLEESS
jgi:hypothetical protein